MSRLRRLLPALVLGAGIAIHPPLCHASLWGDVKKEAGSAADALKGAAKRGGHVIQKGAKSTADAIDTGAHRAVRAIRHATDGNKKDKSSKADKKAH